MSAEAEELCNQGLELMTQHRWEEAEEKMVKAIGHDWESPELRYNLGKCLFHQDKYEEAEKALSAAIMLRAQVPAEDGEMGVVYPVRWNKYPEASALLGSCKYALGRVQSAWQMFNAAVDPANTNDFNRECKTAAAHCLLAQGNYSDWGWNSYQQRLKEPDTWNGTQSLVGKTLLVKAEGGLGDQIFFHRYDELLGALGAGYVIWEVDEPLKDYFGSMVVVRGKEIPDHDYMVHAGSLPYIFGTKIGTIPVFNSKSSFVKNPKRIGIACSGNPLHPDDHHRSIPLVEFDPLWELDKDFYFVQKNIRESDKQDWMGAPMEDVEFESCYGIHDYMRAKNIDLVITVDTMTAHLAGAEGVPTWLLLPYACDWRWGLEGDRTPWYPAMKIFRQGPDREWGPVIQRVVEELKNEAQSKL